MKKAFYLILAGVAIGLLIAPAKGSETWQKIKDSFDDLKNDSLDHVNDIIADGQSKVSKVKKDASRLANDF
jgi:gas vesicle protein